MQNLLVTKNIISPSGKIVKEKINLISGAMTLPFAETVWITTSGDRETINRLTDIFVSMNTPPDRVKLFKIIQMLYGVTGVQFPDEAVKLSKNASALEYFIFSFILDFNEIISDFIAEEKGS